MNESHAQQLAVLTLTLRRMKTEWPSDALDEVLRVINRELCDFGFTTNGTVEKVAIQRNMALRGLGLPLDRYTGADLDHGTHA